MTQNELEQLKQTKELFDEILYNKVKLYAKLYLNNLYGKMATSPVNITKEPFLEIDIECRQPNYDRFLYCDTDSIHIIRRNIVTTNNIYDKNDTK